MIIPTAEDIGRRVVYRPHPAGPIDEEGVITSFNADYVFVCYGADVHSKATSRLDLDWLAAAPTRPPAEQDRDRATARINRLEPAPGVSVGIVGGAVPRPAAWFRSPTDYEWRVGEDRPEGDGWVPLYRFEAPALTDKTQLLLVLNTIAQDRKHPLAADPDVARLAEAVAYRINERNEPAADDRPQAERAARTEQDRAGHQAWLSLLTDMITWGWDKRHFDSLNNRVYRFVKAAPLQSPAPATEAGEWQDARDLIARTIVRSWCDTDAEFMERWADKEVTRHNAELDADRILAALSANGLVLSAAPSPVKATQEMVEAAETALIARPDSNNWPLVISRVDIELIINAALDVAAKSGGSG